MARIFAYVPHARGVADEAAAELLTAAAKIDAGAAPVAILTGSGPELDQAAESLKPLYSEIWKVSAEALAQPNAEVVRKALIEVIPAGSIVLVPHSHFGWDLSPGLSIKLNAAYLPDVLDIVAVGGGSLTAVRTEFGGQISVHVRCDISTGVVINTRPGAFAAAAPSASGAVVDKPITSDLTSGRRYLQTIEAEGGDVDITKQNVLVSIGRGIQEADNIEIAQELADALGCAVSCSRPVVDAKWLDKSRQIGSSGKTVKPKVYLALGISGSFQHLAGLKGNPFIIAVNKNSKAPIFRVAQVGIVDDILEFMPALTERVRQQGSMAQGAGR